MTTLVKSLTYDELNLQVLRSLSRAWKPKVTVISEKTSIFKMSLAALFCKLREHELEFDWLERHELTHGKLGKHEGREVKVRSLAFKSKYVSD